MRKKQKKTKNFEKKLKKQEKYATIIMKSLNKGTVYLV
jgi:hypothetical protein